MSYSHERVARASQLLQAMAARPEDSGGFNDLLDFLAWLADLGRGRISLDIEECRNFVAESAPLLMQGLRHMRPFITNMEELFSRNWYGSEWVNACEKRSQIEFLRTLYWDVLPKGELEFWLDTEELDDRIQQRAPYEGGLEPHRIPVGTPPSHWWWWAPDRPPNDKPDKAAPTGK